MKIYFLGTCAGTEPMPDRKHTSFAVECGETLYWFDAGEGCSYTAHNMGLDLLKVRKIVISHPHMDHVGGLGNLLWTIRKLMWCKKLQHLEDVDVYIPNLQVWDGLLTMLQHTEGGFKTNFQLTAHETREGVLFDDGDVRVTASHTIHMQPVDGKWQSYAFLIEAEGKRLVYSGDVKAYTELDGLIGEGCDGLIIETGHFVIDDVYAYTKNKPIGKIFFNHNGREILYGLEAAAQKVQNLFGDRAVIAYDTMSAVL